MRGVCGPPRPKEADDKMMQNPGIWIKLWMAQWVRSLDLTTRASLSPIQRGFAPGFANYKKGCTRLAVASDKVYQLLGLPYDHRLRRPRLPKEGKNLCPTAEKSDRIFYWVERGILTFLLLLVDMVYFDSYFHAWTWSTWMLFSSTLYHFCFTFQVSFQIL
jgi:hypothetical protein